MKRRVIATGLALGLAGLAVILWRFLRHPDETARLSPSREAPAAEARPAASDKTLGEAVMEPAWRAAQTAEFLAAHQRHVARRSGSVEFHGRVIDQAHHPVAGAEVKLEIHRDHTGPLDLLRWQSDIRTEPVTVATDAAGWFHLSRGRARSVYVLGVEKEGYLWINPGLGGFSFGGYSKNPDRPYADPQRGLTFHVWKKGPTEPLVRNSIRVPLRIESTDTHVNLFTGSLATTNAAGADLTIRIPLATPDNPSRQWNRWFILEPVRGAIQESEDVYPYAAPVEGYRPAWQWLYQPLVQGSASEQWKRTFYLSLRRGRIFAGLTVEFQTAPPAFVIDALVNPSGSRNLEPDPAKQISDPEEIQRLDRQTRGEDQP